MRNLFKKHRKATPEAAPQLTRWDRVAYARPGNTFGQLSYQVYDEMLKDSMVQTVLTLKKLAIQASGFEIRPFDSSAESKKRSDFIIEAFARMEGSPVEVIGNATDSFAKGWSIQEMVFENSKDHIWLKSVRPKNPAMFGLKVDNFGNISSLTLQVPGELELSLPREKFVIHIHRRSYSQPKGQSDLDASYKHWQAKQSLLAAWKLQLEKFAMPTVLGSYERGLPPEEQVTILQALQDIQNKTAVVYPQEIEVSLLGGQKEPSTAFQEAIEFHNREIARAVLGQTLTTDEGRRVGSLALGKVHLQILLLQVNSLRREFAETVMSEQLIRPLVEINFGPGYLPKFEFKESGTGVFTSGDLK